METAVIVGLVIAALIMGVVAVAEAHGRGWAGWGVICLALADLIARFPRG